MTFNCDIFVMFEGLLYQQLLVYNPVFGSKSELNIIELLSQISVHIRVLCIGTVTN